MYSTHCMGLCSIPSLSEGVFNFDKKEMGFSNLDKTIESIVFLALIDYPKEVEKLEKKILKLESKIKQMRR